MVAIDQAWNSYLDYLSALRKSRATLKQYKIEGAQFCRFAALLDQYHIDECFITILKQYVNQLKEDYSNPQTYNHKIIVLRGFVNFIQMREWVSIDDMDTLFNLQEKMNARIDVLSSETIQEILNVWPKHLTYAKSEENAWLALRNHCVILTLFETGCKPAELLKMKWQHINFEQCEIRLFNSHGYRVIVCSKEVIHQLQLFFQATVQMTNNNVCEWVWVGEKNKQRPVTTKTIERVMQTISKDLGIAIRATDIRYATLHKDSFALSEELLQSKYGYVRKWVMMDRTNRFDSK